MGRSKTLRISKSVVDKLEPNTVAWDNIVPGFGVRQQRRFRVYFLKCVHRGRQRWITIGKHGSPWSVDNARKEAQRLLGLIAGGQYPDGSRTRLTVVDLARRYLAEHAGLHKKLGSALNDKQNIQNHVIPLLGHFAIADVNLSDIE